jgi:hypothetical protein
MMALLYLLFTKFVPMISIWEMKVGLQPHGGGIVTTATIDGRRRGLVLEGPLPTDVPE